MALLSPKYPTWDEQRVREAIVHYYNKRGYSIHKIAAGLKLSYWSVRRVLLSSPDVELREYESRTISKSDGTKLRRCESCGEDLPLTSKYFHRDKSKVDGFRYVCKDCRSQTGR